MSASGHIGNLGWQCNQDALISSVSSLIVFHPAHRGVIALTTQSGTLGYVFLDNSSGTGRPLLASSFDFMQFTGMFETPPETGDGIAFGAMMNFGVDGTQEGIYFKSQEGENWQAITCDGYGTTQTDTGVAFSADTWYFFNIVNTMSVFTFYINETLVATHNTNITDEPLAPMYGLSAATIGGFQILIDYFGLQLSPLIAAWD